MRVHKYYVRPVDETSELKALDEIARYVQARNRLLQLSRKWQRIREEQILPEFRTLAEALRDTPRTGRKPTKKRSDHDELRAADSRALYREFIDAGGSYATWWLAEAASKKAKHPLREEDAGRAGILPERLLWEGNIVHYAGTAWSLEHAQLRKRPMPEGVRVAQAWLQRERLSTGLLPKPRYSWFLVVVLDGIGPRQFEVPAQRTAAGMDLAWRQDDDTLRVAYVADDDGHHHPVRMRAQQYTRLMFAERLASFVDEDANKLRAEFKVPANTSHRRLLELAPKHPVAQHLIHIADWHHGARAKAIRSRDAHYLQEIHDLCRAHHTIFVEKIKAVPKLTQKASTRRKKPGAAADAEGGVARDQRQLAAPFLFLRTLQRVAPQFGTEVIEVPAAYTSRVCFACEHDMGPGSLGVRTCTACGQKWDVDHLAALNLLYNGTKKSAAAAE